LKSAQANSFARPYLEKTLHKKMAGRVAQGVGPEFKSQYHKNKKTKHSVKIKEVLFYF
jgi:hypothetical protein